MAELADALDSGSSGHCARAGSSLSLIHILGFDNGSQRYILYLQKGEAEKNEDGVNQYMNYDGQWTEMTLQKTDAMNSVQIYNTAENMETLLAAAENCTMQENGGKAVISADIPAEKLYDVEAAGRFFQIAGMSSLSEVYFKGIGEDVYKRQPLYFANKNSEKE